MDPKRVILALEAAFPAARDTRALIADGGSMGAKGGRGRRGWGVGVGGGVQGQRGCRGGSIGPKQTDWFFGALIVDIETPPKR